MIGFEVNIPDDNVCPHCGNPSLELYDSNGKPRHYGALLLRYHDNKSEMTDTFRHVELSHFQCLYCQRKYYIDWTYRYPIPLYFKGGYTNGH